MFSTNINIIDTYLISFDTYLIEPVQHEGKLYSRVYDKNGVFIVGQKPLYLVRNSCHILGSNYNNARQIAKDFFGPEKHKLPIIISHDYGIPNVFFPLLSPTSVNNIWIGQHAVVKILPHSEFAELTIKDGKKIVLPLNDSSINALYSRATQLQKFAANQRIIIRKELNQHLNEK